MLSCDARYVPAIGLPALGVKSATRRYGTIGESLQYEKKRKKNELKNWGAMTGTEWNQNAVLLVAVPHEKSTKQTRYSHFGLFFRGLTASTSREATKNHLLRSFGATL